MSDILSPEQVAEIAARSIHLSHANIRDLLRSHEALRAEVARLTPPETIAIAAKLILSLNRAEIAGKSSMDVLNQIVPGMSEDDVMEFAAGALLKMAEFIADESEVK